MKITRYCTCGGSMVGTINPDSKAAALVKAWEQCHAGEGHAACDQKTAAAARRKQDRAMERTS